MISESTSDELPTMSVIEVSNSEPVVKKSQSTIPSTFQDGGKLHAEIRWALKHVKAGYRDNSVEDEVAIFRVMFPDSGETTAIPNHSL